MLSIDFKAPEVTNGLFDPGNYDFSQYFVTPPVKYFDKAILHSQPKLVNYYGSLDEPLDNKPLENVSDIFGIKFETWGEVFERHAGEKESAHKAHQSDIDGLDIDVEALEHAPTFEKKSRARNVVSRATGEGYFSLLRVGSRIGEQFAKMAERHAAEIDKAIDEGLHIDPSKRALIKAPFFYDHNIKF